VNSTIAPVEDTPQDAPAKKLVKVSVTIDEAEFDRDIDNAFRAIGKEVKLPGFRQGKVRYAMQSRSIWPTLCATTTSI
jgi:Bacterial trigger factor protein (TF)